jgi:DNA polymerase III sliding clamp (beta) subunit (PCNA family)
VATDGRILAVGMIDGSDIEIDGIPTSKIVDGSYHTITIPTDMIEKIPKSKVLKFPFQYDSETGFIDINCLDFKLGFKHIDGRYPKWREVLPKIWEDRTIYNVSINPALVEKLRASLVPFKESINESITLNFSDGGLSALIVSSASAPHWLGVLMPMRHEADDRQFKIPTWV